MIDVNATFLFAARLMMFDVGIKRRQGSVQYIVMSFPQTSETFVSEEAFSLQRFGITPYILTMGCGRSDIVHRTARQLVDSGLVDRFQHMGNWAALKAFLWLLTQRPRHTISGLRKALSAGAERWRYFSLLPYVAVAVKRNAMHIHAHFANENFLCARVMSHWTGVPYGVTVHGYDLRDSPIPNQLHSLLSGASCVVAASEFNKRLLIERFGMTDSGIQIVRCGIDISRFQASQRPAVRGGIVQLITVGRLHQVKGHDVLIRALSLLCQKGMKVHLRIVGDGDLLDSLRNLAEQLYITAQIAFVGMQPQERVRDLLNESDLFVLPSRVEGGPPVACMEAMAMGLPVVATSVTAVPEIVNETNGMLVPPEQPEALANAIWELTNDPERMANMRRSARETVLNHFERSACTGQLLRCWGIESLSRMDEEEESPA